jgi:Fur family transcriptional regulator, zinc uptake regulator
VDQTNESRLTLMTDLITQAEDLCARAGTHLTDPRRRVLGLLVAAKTPLKAYDIIAKAGADGGATKPPTVYRALEFLCQMGVVHRIEQDATYVACNHIGHSHLAALFVCDNCLAVTEVPMDDLQPRLTGAAQNAGFQLSHIVIEGRGRCGPCLALAA